MKSLIVFAKGTALVVSMEIKITCRTGMRPCTQKKIPMAIAIMIKPIPTNTAGFFKKFFIARLPIDPVRPQIPAATAAPRQIGVTLYPRTNNILPHLPATPQKPRST